MFFTKKWLVGGPLHCKNLNRGGTRGTLFVRFVAFLLKSFLKIFPLNSLHSPVQSASMVEDEKKLVFDCQRFPENDNR